MKRNLLYLCLFSSFFGLASLLVACETEELGSGFDPGDDEAIEEEEDQEEEDPGFSGDIDSLVTFGGSDEDEAVSVIEVAGGFVVGGRTRSTDGDLTGRTGDDWDYWVIRLDTEGNRLWQQTYGGSADERLASLSATSDGGFILSGYSRSSDGDVGANEGFHDFWIVKIDAQGGIDWERNFGYVGSDQAFDVLETTDGGYLATGFLDVDASGGEGNDDRAAQHGVGDFWAVKMDAEGEWIWRRYFGGTNNDRASQALELEDGNYLLFGSSESDDFDITDSKGSYDFWAVKVTPLGEKIWTRSYGGSQIDIGNAACISNNGNILLTGDVRSADGDISDPLGNADIWIAEIDPNGNLIKERTLGGTAFESARDIYAFDDGILVVGSTRSTDGDVQQGLGENDAWIVWLNNDGTIAFQRTVGGSSFDFGEAVIPTNDRGLLMVGHTESEDGDVVQQRGKKDLMVVKFK